MPDESPEPTEPSEPRRRAGRNLTVAIATGLILAGSIFGTLYTSKVAWFLLVSAAVLLAQWELYRALSVRDGGPATTLGLVGGGALLVAAYQGGPGALTFALALSVVATFLWYLADPDRSDVAERIAATIFGLLYVPFLGAHVVLMRDLSHGVAITISFIGLTAFYDIGAYTAGVLFGKHPMAPTISPKKTWEGAAGATLFVFLTAFIAGPLIPPFTTGTAALLAATVALVAPLGDLAESLIKRDLDIKDMGSLLPGHGGVLDRVDALLLMAPAAYWLVRGVVR